MRDAGPTSWKVPRSFHATAALAVISMIAVARANEAAYEYLVQEDRFIEWLTVAFFLAAALVGGIRAIRTRSVADGLVALFCIAAAGEEVSWGQRFMGFTPPDIFLANNAQQEANLHNLFEAFGQPKWTLIGLLAAYGIALPLANRAQPLRLLAARLRVTVPAWGLVPWYALAIALLVAYPVRFTGEWVEALAGALFFFSARPAPRVAFTGTLLCAVVALACDRAAGALVPPGARSPAMVACARAEAGALLERLRVDVPDAFDDNMHRRVWSLWKETFPAALLPDAGPAVPGACGDEPADGARRRRWYAVDPWGSAYWVRITDDSMSIYSFGPNRRRHVGASTTGDDIVVALPARAKPQ